MPPPDDRSVQDVVIIDAVEIEDVAIDTITPSSLVLGDYVSVRKDNLNVEGEVLAIYDHSVFWGTPEDKVTFALYRDQSLKPFPNDESVRLFNASDVEIFEARAPLNISSFRERSQALRLPLSSPPLEGSQYILMGNSDYHLEEEGFGHFAYDLTRFNEEGARFQNAGDLNEDYFVFGNDVHSPVSGTVVDVIRHVPDNTPGTFPNPEDYLNTPQNLLGIHLYGNYYLYLLHFEFDSIPEHLTFGSVINERDFLGRVGNSGVSLEPHLHASLYYYDAASERSWSVPLFWRDVIVDGAFESFVVPQTGQSISAP